MYPSPIKYNAFEEVNRGFRPLVLDGAMGSYIQQKGFITDDILWTTQINQTNPDLILQIHSEYIEAGADIITTNTFRTNPAAIKNAGLDNFSEYVKSAVGLAKLASSGKKVFLAGSNAPAEDCYQTARILSNNELENNHKYHIDLLIDSGVHFILNETQSHFDEIRIICEHCDRYEIPNVLSLFLTKKLQLLSGESLDSVLNYLSDHKVMAIGFNCISPDLFMNLIGSIQLPSLWGFYLNCGSGNPTDKIINCGIEPEEYLKTVKKTMAFKPAFIGSCCGSSPAHIMKIREYVDGQNYS